MPDNGESGKLADHGTPAGGDERRAEIEAVARALQARYLGRDDWRTFADEARTAIEALDRVRDARNDDEGVAVEIVRRLRYSDGIAPDEAVCEIADWIESQFPAARPPQDEDHDRLRAAAKRVLEADMRGIRDIDALNALEDAAGFSQQGQRRSSQSENHETSDAVRERPTRHLPVNGPDDRQPNAPDRGQLRDAATPASGRGRSSEQGEDHEAAIEALTAELQALVDWFNDAPFLRAERLLHDLGEERGRDAR